MADFSTIKGFNVQTLSADPPAPGVGQVWYNTTTGTMKGYGQVGTAAWSAGGAMPAGRYGSGMSGTQTAAILYGGHPGDVNTTYLYNGASWTVSPATLGLGSHNMVSAGCGTQTAAQIAGGEFASSPYYSTRTEQFNGTAWTEVADLNTGRGNMSAGGSQTAAVTAMGSPFMATTESWNGSSWTEVTAAPWSTYAAMGGGTQTSFIIAGGWAPPASSYNTAAYWDGSTWTEVATINTARQYGSRGSSDGTSAVIFGGGAPPPWTTKTENWDGSTWTELADMSSPIKQNAGCGNALTAFSAGKEGPTGSTATEEWTTPTTTKTFTAS